MERQTPRPLPKHQGLWVGADRGSRLHWEPMCVVWEAEVVQAPHTVGPESPGAAPTGYLHTHMEQERLT